LAPQRQGIAALGLGLAVVMWNYSGWDTPATVLGETRAPERTFRLAAFLALPVLTACYVVPVGVALASRAVEWSTWTTGILPVIARQMGGDWLGHAVAAGAVVATAGLFLSLLLTNSRLPYVLARDRAMPAWLGVVFPSLFMLGAIATAGWLNTLAGVVAALTGPVAYAMLRRPTSDSPR